MNIGLNAADNHLWCVVVSDQVIKPSHIDFEESWFLECCICIECHNIEIVSQMGEWGRKGPIDPLDYNM